MSDPTLDAGGLEAATKAAMDRWFGDDYPFASIAERSDFRSDMREAVARAIRAYLASLPKPVEAGVPDFGADTLALQLAAIDDARRRGAEIGGHLAGSALAASPLPAQEPIGYVAPSVIASLRDGRAANHSDISRTRGNVYREPLFASPQPHADGVVMPPVNESETYYAKGHDAAWFEGLSDREAAWELMKASQDLNDTGLGDYLDRWMPHNAMLADAAVRINRLLASPQPHADGVEAAARNG